MNITKNISVASSVLGGEADLYQYVAMGVDLDGESTLVLMADDGALRSVPVVLCSVVGDVPAWGVVVEVRVSEGDKIREAMAKSQREGMNRPFNKGGMFAWLGPDADAQAATLKSMAESREAYLADKADPRWGPTSGGDPTCYPGTRNHTTASMNEPEDEITTTLNGNGSVTTTRVRTVPLSESLADAQLGGLAAAEARREGLRKAEEARVAALPPTIGKRFERAITAVRQWVRKLIIKGEG